MLFSFNSLKGSFGDGSAVIELQQHYSGAPILTQVLASQKGGEANQAKSSGGPSSGGSNGGGSSGGGGGSCNCGTWGNLRDIAEKNPNKNAGDIIREWRKNQ